MTVTHSAAAYESDTPGKQSGMLTNLALYRKHSPSCQWRTIDLLYRHDALRLRSRLQDMLAS